MKSGDVARSEQSSTIERSGSEHRGARPSGWSGRLEAAWGSAGTGVVGFFCCGATLAVVGVLAWTTGLPWVFPSLAPTALLVFETPLRAQASPRHTIVGHAVGIASGYVFLVLFGLSERPAVTVGAFTVNRVGAVSLAVAATTLVLHAVGSAHPPAGASALVVSLGILKTPSQLGVMAAAVLLVTALAWMFNRLTGVDVPIWSPRSRTSNEGAGPDSGHVTFDDVEQG
jgi:CBS-domain-containing membrane protein